MNRAEKEIRFGQWDDLDGAIGGQEGNTDENLLSGVSDWHLRDGRAKVWVCAGKKEQRFSE